MQHSAPSGTAATPANRDSAQPSGASVRHEGDAVRAKPRRALPRASAQKNRSRSEVEGHELADRTRAAKDMKAKAGEGRDNQHEGERP